MPPDETSASVQPADQRREMIWLHARYTAAMSHAHQLHSAGEHLASAVRDGQSKETVDYALERLAVAIREFEESLLS